MKTGKLERIKAHLIEKVNVKLGESEMIITDSAIFTTKGSLS